MNCEHGDVILIPFPYSDLSSSKKRPALVLSNNSFNRSSSDLICCLITRNPKKDKWSVSIDEADVEKGSLHFKSKVKPYRIFTTDKSIVLKKLCRLKKAKLIAVIENLHKVLSAL